MVKSLAAIGNMANDNTTFDGLPDGRFFKTIIATLMSKHVSSLLRVAAVLCAVILLMGCQSQKSAAAAGLPAEKTTVAQSAPPVVPVPANMPFRVKAGLAAPFTDSEGKVWLADQGFDGGDTVDRDASTTISGTKDATLFLSEHYGMTSFSCKLPNGKYTAKLYFAETFDGITGPGQRIFSINVQGHEFKDFDVWVKAGGANRAYIETVPVEVTNGVFRIDFTTNIENPEINAVEIVPQP